MELTSEMWWTAVLLGFLLASVLILVIEVISLNFRIKKLENIIKNETQPVKNPSSKNTDAI